VSTELHSEDGEGLPAGEAHFRFVAKRWKGERAMSKNETTLLPDESDADACRRLGFGVGTRIAGNQGDGVTIIEITAIGDKKILAKAIYHFSFCCKEGKELVRPECVWTLSCLMWVEAPKS